MSIDESYSSVVEIYIIRPKPGPVTKNATPRPSGWEYIYIYIYKISAMVVYVIQNHADLHELFVRFSQPKSLNISGGSRGWAR